MDEVRHYDALPGFFFLACICFVIIVINFFILRWIFSINRQLRKQDVIIKTLLLIAKQNGASDEELRYLYDEHYKSYKGSL